MRKLEFRLWSKTAQCIIPWEDVRHKPHTIFDSSNWIPMQYTGFIDKYGTKIFEGDIIFFAGRLEKYSVVFEYGSFYCHSTTMKNYEGNPIRWGLLSRAFEISKFGDPAVTGNIYDK